MVLASPPSIRLSITPLPLLLPPRWNATPRHHSTLLMVDLSRVCPNRSGLEPVPSCSISSWQRENEGHGGEQAGS